MLCQGAYRSGRLSTALATILVFDPLTAIGVGVFALREPVSTSFPLAIDAETLLLVAGIVVLARSSHGAREHAGRSPVPLSIGADTAAPVLIGTDTYAPDVNGAARFTQRLASGLAVRGHHVHVVTPSTSRQPYREQLDRVTVHRIPSRSTPFHPSFRVCLFPRVDVARVVAEVRPAVVHIQGHFLIGRALSALARRGGIPLVATNHFMPENLPPYASAPGWLERLLATVAWRDVARVFRRARAVTAPTPIAADLLRARGLGRPVTPISCGIDLDRFAPYDGRRDPGLFGLPDRPTLLFVGRLDAEKRIHDLIDALPAVRHPAPRTSASRRGARRGTARAFPRRPVRGTVRGRRRSAAYDRPNRLGDRGTPRRLTGFGVSQRGNNRCRCARRSGHQRDRSRVFQVMQEVGTSVTEDRDYRPSRLTPAARERLTKELDELRATRAEFTRSLDSAEPMGDDADQAEAIERRMSRDRLDKRIAEMESLLAHAEDAAPAGDVVEVGTVVTVRFPEGTQQALRVGDLAEDDDQTTVLTPDSPLGRALLGRRAGDSVTYTAPDGETHAQVVSVRADAAG